MNNPFKVAIAVLPMALAAGPALAQANQQRDAQIAPPGVYVRGSLGYGWSAEDEIDYSPLWGIGVGYRLNPNIRADVTIDWRDRFLVEGGQNIAGVGNFDSKVDNRSLMLNVYYDFDHLPIVQLPGGFKPYVGAGIGFSRIEVNDQDVLVGGTTVARFTGDDKNQLGYQLMAGVSYNINANFALDLGYRYANLGDVELSSTLGDIESELSTHELVATVRYHF